MENPTKTKKKSKNLLGKILALLAVCVVLCLMVLPCFALPTIGPTYYAPLSIQASRLSSRTGGTQVGQFYSIEDAFSSSAGWSAYVSQSITISGNDNLTVAYRSALDELTNPTILYDVPMKYYASISGKNPNDNSVTGSFAVFKSAYYDEPFADSEWVTNGYLFKLQSQIVGNSDDMVIWVNMPSTTNMRFWYACDLIGYDEYGNTVETQSYGRLREQGTNFFRFSVLDIATATATAYDGNARFFVQSPVSTEQLVYVKSLRVYCDVNYSSVPTHGSVVVPFNWIRGYSAYVGENSTLVRDTRAEYYARGVASYLYRDTPERENYFVNGNWFNWLITAVKGVFDVKLFGDTINFTIGGLLALVISCGLVGVFIKLLHGG